MLVFLVRHAHADPGEPDELRPLSSRGRVEAKALARDLAAHETPPAVVLSSPLLRARQTAEVVARSIGTDVLTDERLAPGTTLESLRAVVAGRDTPIAVVGHQPDCSEICVALTGGDPGFAPGGHTVLELS